MPDLRETRFGPQQQLLHQLSDQALQQEAERRRHQRHQLHQRHHTTTHSPTITVPTSSRSIRQAYANLELPENAPLTDVEHMYRELRERYRPEKHIGDGDRFRAATELTASLQEAYETLREHLRS